MNFELRFALPESLSGEDVEVRDFGSAGRALKFALYYNGIFRTILVENRLFCAKCIKSWRKCKKNSLC